MKALRVVRWVTAASAAGAVIAGCGPAAGDARSTGPSASPSVLADDTALSAAADEVDEVVRPRYEGWYASTVLDQRRGVLTVYRKPGSALDAAVRARVSGVQLVFEDAAMSEKDMLAAVRRIMADTGYWRDQGIVVTGGGPLEDGSGVRVTTRVGAEEEAVRLTEHYGSPVVVERGIAVAAPASPFTMPPVGPASSAGVTQP